MLEERERHLAAVHAAIERGIADIDAGRGVRRSGL
jgi:predicted transcriptional regulator